MKEAKDLIIPFDWENRRPVCLDRFFYVPSCYPYTPLKIPFFENENPVMIEYCSGSGHWILKKATESSHLNWIAVEKKFERARKIWRKAQSLSIENLFVVCSEAFVFTQFYAPLAEEAFINFPDPWPKLRHAKHRLVQASFTNALLPLFKEGGQVTTATDDEKYAFQMVQEFEKSGGWKVTLQTHDLPEYGDSFFKSLWEKKGRKIYYSSFKKVLL